MADIIRGPLTSKVALLIFDIVFKTAVTLLKLFHTFP